MPFTPTPDFNQPFGWASFVGKYVVLEPKERLYGLQTRYGTQDAWDCTTWVLTRTENGNALIPHSGIRIFNSTLVMQLDKAYETGNPIAGHVHKGGSNGNATVIEVDNSPAMELLASLWADVESEAMKAVAENFNNEPF